MTTLSTATRNAGLQDLATLLRERQTRKVDVVVPATKVRSVGGLIHISGAEPVLDDAGVTEANGVYRPTAIFDEGIADKLGIPLSYVRKMRESRPDLYDANVNGWLHGSETVEGDDALTGFPADGRKFMARLFSPVDGEAEGIARALLSDTYKRIDDLDVLMAALDGIRQAGTNIEVVGCDLNDRNMRVRIVAPEITALASTLLDGYRSPFREGGARRVGGEGWATDVYSPEQGGGHTFYEAGTEPVVFAGLELRNSEVGGGAFAITPRIVIRRCRNGLTIGKDVVRAIHVGEKMGEGLVRWSDETQAKNLALITSKAKDAVATFLDADYVLAKVTEIEQQAGVPVTNAQETITTLGKALSFDEATTQSILDHFILGGQMTAGGVLNAVTSVAQTIEDADKAADLEGTALRALELVAAG